MNLTKRFDGWEPFLSLRTPTLYTKLRTYLYIVFFGSSVTMGKPNGKGRNIAAARAALAEKREKQRLERACDVRLSIDKQLAVPQATLSHALRDFQIVGSPLQVHIGKAAIAVKQSSSKLDVGESRIVDFLQARPSTSMHFATWDLQARHCGVDVDTFKRACTQHLDYRCRPYWYRSTSYRLSCWVRGTRS